MDFNDIDVGQKTLKLLEKIFFYWRYHRATKNLTLESSFQTQIVASRNMFSSIVDLQDAPPAWWELDCVKYAPSYTPVRSRLTLLMGSNVVRLTDRRYMTRLAFRLQKDYEEQQKARIERRKLKITSIVPELREVVPRSLLRMTRRRRPCAPKFHADAAKKCKQLPQLLMTDEF